MTPTLYIFAGLPGTGKSTLSQWLAREVGAAYLRIDTIEQGLRDLCSVEVQGEGYGLAYRIAADNLRVGRSVVADSCNPIEPTRRAWERSAREAGADYVHVEVVCSDRREHRLRAETRAPTVPGLRLPTWSEIESREVHPWTVDRVIVDTAGRSPEECGRELLSRITPQRRSRSSATDAPSLVLPPSTPFPTETNEAETNSWPCSRARTSWPPRS